MIRNPKVAIAVLATVAGAATLAPSAQAAEERPVQIGPALASPMAVPGGLAFVPFNISHTGAKPARYNLGTIGGRPVGTTFAPKRPMTKRIRAAAMPPNDVLRRTPPRWDVTMTADAGVIGRASSTGQVLVKPASAVKKNRLVIASTKVKATRLPRRLGGFIQLRGRIANPAKVNVLIRHRGARKLTGTENPPLTLSQGHTFRLAGTFRKRIRIAPGMLRGIYDLHVSPIAPDGTALKAQKRSLRVGVDKRGAPLR